MARESRNHTYSVKKQVSAHLSDELKSRYDTRTIAIRQGDSVRVMRGEFAGLEGKVDTVDRPRARIFVEGMTREKTTGGASSRLSVHASKVILTNLNLSDKWRSSLLEDKAKTAREKESEEGTA